MDQVEAVNWINTPPEEQEKALMRSSLPPMSRDAAWNFVARAGATVKMGVGHGTGARR